MPARTMASQNVFTSKKPGPRATSNRFEDKTAKYVFNDRVESFSRHYCCCMLFVVVVVVVVGIVVLMLAQLVSYGAIPRPTHPHERREAKRFDKLVRLASGRVHKCLPENV